MTKKESIVIAELVKNLPVDYDTHTVIIDRFCVALAKDNPRFNRDVFVSACRGNHEVTE